MLSHTHTHTHSLTGSQTHTCNIRQIWKATCIFSRTLSPVLTHSHMYAFASTSSCAHTHLHSHTVSIFSLTLTHTDPWHMEQFISQCFFFLFSYLLGKVFFRNTREERKANSLLWFFRLRLDQPWRTNTDTHAHTEAHTHTHTNSERPSASTRQKINNTSL